MQIKKDVKDLKSILGTHQTTVGLNEHGQRVIRYCSTDVVTWDNNTIILNTGGHETSTTKRRMNEVSEMFKLKFRIFSKNKKWMIEFQDRIFKFHGPVHILNRHTTLVVT